MFSWSSLKKLPENKFISSMYIWLFLVPVPAKLLAKTNDVAKVRVFEYSFELNLTLPFNWKILFFCSLSFVIANIIYTIFCPNLIKDHSNFSHFDNEGKGLEQLEEYCVAMNTDPRSLPKFSKALRLKNSPMLGAVDKISREFWEIFNFGNNIKHKTARIISIVFYGLGFFLLGLLIYQNILWVVKVTFPS